MINNLIRRLVRRLGSAIYAFIFALAVVFFLLQLGTNDELLRSLFLNLSCELIGAALIFFLVKQVFGYDDEEWRQGQQEYLLGELENRLSKRELTLYPSRRSIYDSGINALKSDHWKKVRVFAPVGLWREDELKKKWLEALAESARVGKLETVWGVFGLPPTKKDDKVLPPSQVVGNLEYVKQVLGLFNGLKNVRLHFYPPSDASIGFGVLIFQRKDNTGNVAFCLASHEYEDVVNRGFGIDNDQVFSYAIDWFDDRIFWKATNAFVLQDDSTSLMERWNDIVKKWYGEDYLPTQ